MAGAALAKVAVAPLAIGLILAAGGAAAAAPAVRAEISGSGPVTTHRHLYLTEADNGRTLMIPRGVEVSVGLNSDGPSGIWAVPVSSDTDVLQPRPSSASQDGSAEAVFLTGQPGTSQVIATESWAPGEVLTVFTVDIIVIND
ncbi:hypothetical protein [Streptomyces sp. NPDC048419]|uniref:hypothetical protein n=1 Tax=Streptomyces sp. NPDC048419 TaxID=3365547 RepID=UPI003719869B